jgi:MFS family permease
MAEAMPSLVPAGTDRGTIALYNQIALVAFLVGGAAGGILFGMLADRIGRTRTMMLTILVYSLFTCLSALSKTWWHLAVFRFLVALGVGGEWAVASALVAEVFPTRARAWSLGIFHASSVFGTFLAIAAGVWIIGNPQITAYANQIDMPSFPWRLGFGLGALPALLILWIRRSLHEPDSWRALHAARSAEAPVGSVAELFARTFFYRTTMGVLLATVGLATFWGTHVYGKDKLKNVILAEQKGQSAQDAEERAATIKRWEMLGMFLVTAGGGLGLVSFGPVSDRIGRRGAFFVFQLGGLLATLILFQMLSSRNAILLMLPLFGYLTLANHAGFAIYFPELYPTRLRGTGTGFCFNAGRLLAAPVLLFRGWLEKTLQIDPMNAATLVGALFVVGMVAAILAPETRGRELLD